MSEQTSGYDPRTDPDSDQYDPELDHEHEPDTEEGVTDDFDGDEEVPDDGSEDPGGEGHEGTDDPEAD